MLKSAEQGYARAQAGMGELYLSLISTFVVRLLKKSETSHDSLRTTRKGEQAMRIGKIGHIHRKRKHRQLFGRQDEAAWVRTLQHAGPNFHFVEVARQQSLKLRSCELMRMVR